MLVLVNLLKGSFMNNEDVEIDDLELETCILEMVQVTMDDNQKGWALLAVTQDKYQEYKVASVSGGALDLNAYGDVLAYNVGETEPTEEEACALTEKFGYQPDLNIEEKLKSVLSEAGN